jgi:hypothetical protein
LIALVLHPENSKDIVIPEIVKPETENTQE